MFLFTTPSPTSAPAPASPVLDAIRQGAERTGTSFEYLLNTAKRESALDPTAKAPTSSATGLFQFIEQTWLGLVKSDGEKLGLGDAAAAVTARPDGTFTVADPATRQTILKLREDPRLAAVMAGALTRQNGAALAAATGRQPTSGELYMAHVLGARGASDLIAAASTDPGRVAASDFPDAARANRNIFYDRSRRPRSAAEVYAVLTAGASSAATTVAAAPAAVTTPVAVPPSSGLRGLFQTEGRTGPISAEVAKIWRTNTEGRTRVAAISFFPRTISDQTVTPEGESEMEAKSATSPTPTAAARDDAAANAPLPPVRPAAEVLARLGAGRRRAAAPLDLASFTRSARP